MTRRAILFGMLLSTTVWAGSYGAYTEPRAGYTVARDISVGSMRDHAREADAFRAKEEAAKAFIAPLRPRLDAWVARAGGVAAYRGWLAAWDSARSTSSQSDYPWSIPAPRAKPVPVNHDAPLAWDDGCPLKLYLHVRPMTTQLARGRALVGFALAEAQLGDGELQLPTEPNLDTVDHIATKLQQIGQGDGFAGQPALVATGVLVLVRKQDELAKIVADAKRAPVVRLLARNLLHGYRHDAWTAADWALATEATKNDPRQTWTWILLFTDEKNLAATRAELERRFPLSDEDRRNFATAWLDSAT